MAAVERPMELDGRLGDWKRRWKGEGPERRERERRSELQG
jgi:hypothetical protein